MINNNASYQLVRRLPRLGLVLASAAAVAMLGACVDQTSTTTPGAPGAGSSSSAPVGQFNDADVMFAQMMIPHHQQAVEMSDIVLAKPGVSAEVRELAQQIKDAQQPEIDQMTGWLQQWGRPTEMPGGGVDHGGMDHGGMDGMLSETELQELRDASDADAQRLFLEGMIAHHEGAVAMAEDEIADGQNADAKALAQQIVTSQQAEIETMRGLLAG